MSCFEPYAYEVIYPNGNGEIFYFNHLAKLRAKEVNGKIRILYTRWETERNKNEHRNKRVV